MSTFTLQDLNLPMTAEDALKAIEQHTPPQPTTKEQWMEHGMNNPLSTNATNEGLLNNITQILHEGKTSGWIPQDAPEPQPTLTNIINTICTQLQLLSTVISQTKAQPEEGTNVPTLQECVALTLQQADWFQDVIRHELEALDITNIAKDAVESIVENEVESYFDHRFSPDDHFDFGDAVSNEVDDRLDDVVRDRLDDVVQEQLDELVAEKLKNIRVVFD